MKVFLLPLLLFCVINSYAQTSTDPKWRTIVSKDSDFSIMLPGDVLVFNDKNLNLVSLSASVPGVSIRVMMSRSPTGAAQMNYFRSIKEKEGFTGDRRSGPGFESGIYVAKKKIYRISQYFRTKAGFYSVDVLAKDENDKYLGQFLSSIVVNSIRIIEIKQAQPTSDARVSVGDLRTSQKVTDTLARKQSNVSRVKNGKQTIDLDIFYSQPLLFLDKPRPRYDDLARIDNVQGTVVLQVQFKSSGDIGDIWVVSGPPQLYNVAEEAAMKIKFLPAEIDGNTVDVIREVEYSFSIY